MEETQLELIAQEGNTARVSTKAEIINALVNAMSQEYSSQIRERAKDKLWDIIVSINSEDHN